jgi:competence protein ComEC
VVAYYFGIISFAGPLATFLLLPALPLVILASAASGIAGLVFLPAGQMIGWLAWLFLSYMLSVVNWLAASPLAFVEVEEVASIWLWLYYAALAAVIIFGRKAKKAEVVARLSSGAGRSMSLVNRLPAKWVVPPLAMVAALVWFSATAIPDDKLHVSFLDVGQGDAILIQQGTQQVLIDGGPSPQAISLELGRQMPFWDRTIELVILTHPDQDHLAGLVEVLQSFRVEKVLSPNLESTSPAYAEWQRLIAEQGIEKITAYAGQQVSLSEATLTVLNPQETVLGGAAGDDENSVVSWLKCGRVSFLFTGDIPAETESRLIARCNTPKSTVLKVAHHDSATSTSEEFLSAVDPQIAAISVGAENKFGHPSPEVVSRLENRLSADNFYRTDHHGTITFITDGERLWFSTGR